MSLAVPSKSLLFLQPTPQPPMQVIGHRTAFLPLILTTAEPGVWNGAVVEAEFILFTGFSREEYWMGCHFPTL